MKARAAMSLCALWAATGCGGDVGSLGGNDAAEDVAGDEPGPDTAPDAPATCPASWPDSGSPCEPEGVTCAYGSETCCGETYPSYVCRCAGGIFGCIYTDACMGAPIGCTCTVDADCEPGGFGRAWCVDETCVPCDDSGSYCDLWCPHGFVPERNGCQPCICAEAPCEQVGTGYCTCDAPCGDTGTTCEAGLGRCVEDFCAVVDCIPGYACDQLRGCVVMECLEDLECRLVFSSCGCQAVTVGDPREALDPCDYDGGALCAVNSCTTDGVLAVCRGGICTEQWGPGCGG